MARGRRGYAPGSKTTTISSSTTTTTTTLDYPNQTLPHVLPSFIFTAGGGGGNTTLRDSDVLFNRASWAYWGGGRPFSLRGVQSGSVSGDVLVEVGTRDLRRAALCRAVPRCPI